MGHLEPALSGVLHFWLGQFTSDPTHVLYKCEVVSRRLLSLSHLQCARIQEHNSEWGLTIHSLGQPSKDGTTLP